MADSTPIVPSSEGNPDNPQLSPSKQAGAVAIVLGAMVISLFIIIAWWPANPTYNKNAVYSVRPFHVRSTPEPINQVGTTTATDNKSDFNLLNKNVVDLKAKIDSLEKLKDTASQEALAADKNSLTDIEAKLKNPKTQDSGKHQNTDETTGNRKDCNWTIQLGNLLLVLVAACGFLGNLIHVSKSLTYYIGMKKFQRSWIPWYFIKPFTASGLALLIYFATSSTAGGAADATPINLFPIMLTAGLAGLFTDIAIQKLKQVFEAILKPADDHPTTEIAPKPQVRKVSVDIDKVEPIQFKPKEINMVKIPGENLDPKSLVIKINEIEIVNFKVTTTGISFSYQPINGEENKNKFLLTVTDVSANLKAEKTWTI